jgi:uncharacterized membrane protein
MAEIKFDDEEQYQQSTQIGKKPFFIALVLSTKLVSTDEQAINVLLGIVGLCIMVAIYFLISLYGNSSKPPVPSITGAPLHSTP